MKILNISFPSALLHYSPYVYAVKNEVNIRIIDDGAFGIYLGDKQLEREEFFSVVEKEKYKVGVSLPPGIEYSTPKIIAENSYIFKGSDPGNVFRNPEDLKKLLTIPGIGLKRKVQALKWIRIKYITCEEREKEIDRLFDFLIV